MTAGATVAFAQFTWRESMRDIEACLAANQTNNTVLPALTICALYKSRWQVELFFIWIKQHLRIMRFLGTSDNAVKTRIWCAVATYVLIAIVKEASARVCGERKRNFVGQHSWARGFFVSTVGRDETVIPEYIKRQEVEDTRLDQSALWR
jgi:IS4 transposase